MSENLKDHSDSLHLDEWKETSSRVESAAERINKVISNIQKVIVGKREVIELSVIALLCEGHLLFEDMPGTGKTMLARTLARSFGCEMKRIQCTPDLLPSDVTGVSVYHPSSSSFEFRPGPIFTQMLLVDEINRTPPRTQSALLEAMEERAVTVDGATRRLSRPFWLIATQNPLDYAGTYPLPEAQVDRFMMRIKLGYPTATEEQEVLTRQLQRHPVDLVEPVMSERELLRLLHEVKNIYIDESLINYMTLLSTATRNDPEIAKGVSPRATLALMRASQAKALSDGRRFVVPDDIKQMMPHIFAHRMMLKASASTSSRQVEVYLNRILQQTKLPK